MSISGNVSLSRLERIYLLAQTDFNTIPSFGNGNYVRHTKATLENDVAVLVRKDKTGHRTTTVGVRGRGYGKWSLSSDLVASGTAGTVPPADPILVSAFCQSPTVVGGTSVTYNLADGSGSALKTFAMASYRYPSTLNQRIAYGCTADKLTWKIGEDIAEFESSGECKFVLDSDYVASGDALTDDLGGLVSFPSEPGSPSVTDGGIIPGFVGSITIGGDQIARIRTATIEMDNQAVVVKDTFGYYEPQDNEADARMITVTLTMYDDDEASMQALRTAAVTKTPLDGDFVVGTVAGSIVEAQLKQIQLASWKLDDSSRRFSLTIPSSRAYGSSISALDELKLIYR